MSLGGRPTLVLNSVERAPLSLSGLPVFATKYRTALARDGVPERLDRRDGMPQNTSRINAVAPAAGDMAVIQC